MLRQCHPCHHHQANLRVRGITLSTQNCIQAGSCPPDGLGHINKHNSESSTWRTTSRVLIRKLVIYSLVHHPFSPWKSDKKIRKIWEKIKKFLAGLRPAPPQRDPWNLCLQGKLMPLTLHLARECCYSANIGISSVYRRWFGISAII